METIPEQDVLFVGAKTKERRHWERIILRHACAWVLLVIVGIFIWNMLQPVWIHNTIGKYTGSNKSATGTKPESVKDVKKNAVAGVTTTTVGIKKEEAPSTKLKLKAEVLIRGLNVRKSASIDSPVVSSVLKGQVIPVYEIKNGWLKVQAKDGTIGYVSGSKKLIKLIE